MKTVTTLFALVICATNSLAADPEVSKTDVFVADTNNYHTYRIPALVTAPDGTLLIFCEGRKASPLDDGDIDMLLRRSTDGGKTWLPTQLVYEEDGDKPTKFGNPCPVVDLETGTIWLTMNRSYGIQRSDRAGGDIFIMPSTDSGQTWSKPRDITKQVKKSSWRHYSQGPGIGIQIQHGPHKGRLVVPANYRESFNNRDPSYAHVMHSDDHGKTWQLGGIVGPHTNECQLVETIERDKSGLLMNMRNHWGRAGKPELSGKRLISRSFDGGTTWSEAVVDPALVEPICQASILRYSWPGKNEKSRILFSNPAGRGRTNMTVRLSYDEGRTWPVSKLIDPGPSAYSCLTKLKDDRIGLVYESENYKKLTFTAFSLDWLTKELDAK